MPKVRRHNVPRAVIEHLMDRVRDREIPIGQLQLLSEWLADEPEVPMRRQRGRVGQRSRSVHRCKVEPLQNQLMVVLSLIPA